MKPRESKIAVVGAGLIGKKHIELVTAAADLTAIVDPVPTAKALADSIGVAWFADLGEYLTNERPDGVIVASPNGFHRAHATACLAAGVPVLVEKPLTDTVEDGRALTKQAAQAKTPLLVGHHRRYSPIVEAAKQIVDEGRLGRLVTVAAMFWLHKPDDYFAAVWRTQAGGGPIYINLIHDIDLLQHLCGPIVEVQACEASDVRGLDVEDSAAIIVRFEAGVLGTITVSDTVSAPWSWELTSGENAAYPQTDQSCYMLGGTEGSLSIPDLRVWGHRGQQSWWSPIDVSREAVPPLDPLAAQFQHFLDVVQGRTAPRVTAADGLRNIEVLDAIKRAATSRGTIAVSRLG